MTAIRMHGLGLCAALGLWVAVPAAANENAGAYLAARMAAHQNDFTLAARYYEAALVADRAETALLENALSAHVSAGAFEHAAPLARRMIKAGIDSEIANLVEETEAAHSGNWAQILTALEAGREMGPLVDGLARAWALFGQGQRERALDQFDQLTRTPELRPFALYHKALALALAGDYAGAEAILSLAPEQGMQRTRRSLMAQAQVLSQLGRNDAALALIDEAFGDLPEPYFAALRDRLAAGETIPFDLIGGPAEGMAEVYLLLAGAIEGETADGYTLLFARAAEYLAPHNAEMLLLSGRLLERLGRPDLASATYDRISPLDPYFQTAELGRARALRDLGRLEAAIEVLRAFTANHAGAPVVHAALGDMLRETGQLRAARDAYSEALAQPETFASRWFVHYARALTLHRLGDWNGAEADLRAALALKPDQPQVLNYLGFSLVERGGDLAEALRMIQAAASAQPENGSIIASLGWVLYHMGRLEEAVEQMETAVALESVDPVITDHLGDIYWAAGREIEARFQWRRALTFDPSPKDAARIRHKLDLGLDAVLAQEGDAPIHVASDRGQ